MTEINSHHRPGCSQKGVSTCVCGCVCVRVWGWVGRCSLYSLDAPPLPSFPSRTFLALPVGPVSGHASVSPAWSLLRPVPRSWHHPEGLEPPRAWGGGACSHTYPFSPSIHLPLSVCLFTFSAVCALCLDLHEDSEQGAMGLPFLIEIAFHSSGK